jgi:hypothetical protein
MDQGIDDDFSVSNRAAMVQMYPLFKSSRNARTINSHDLDV